MIVGTMEVGLRHDGCRTLKEKRSVVKPLIERARQRFSVAAAETGEYELWNASILGFAYVSNDARHARSVLDSLLEWIESHADLTVEWSNFELDRS